MLSCFRQKGDLFSSVDDSRAFLISTISSHSSALTLGTNFALYTYTIRTLPKDWTARRTRPRSTRVLATVTLFNGIRPTYPNVPITPAVLQQYCDGVTGGTTIPWSREKQY